MDVVAERFEVSGVVQGVGFRPFVYRLATELGLDGFVGNDTTRVFVEVGGHTRRLDDFARRLVAEAPPLSRIDTVVREPASVPPPGFRIVESERATGERTLVPPDTATCDECLAELRDPADRRSGHPFITCTNCGPRFTIIRDLPYDRPATTMAGFEMCPACRAEYTDPGDRRYHAQPIACPDCGPTLTYTATGTDDVPPGAADDPIAASVAAIASGRTVAIKGLGGYHLACDATDDDAVALLRARKHRPDKPFALMVGDLDTARRLAEVDEAEAAQLGSPARPIVLVRARAGAAVSPAVAPDNPLLGLMLPSTPIHHLLFDAGAPTMVMTSGNISGEPLAHLDDDARERLGGLCDAFLAHDRPIAVPCDDSVVRLVGDTLLPVRRARGYAPLPAPVGGGKRRVLAVGGELKNTFCLASPDHAWMSQHIGDMENLETLSTFERSVERFMAVYDVDPDVVAVDAHPGYATSRWARARHPDRIVEVQHHHAHVAAVLAEHERRPDEPVLGVAFDGTGYGDDGTIWGGEVLVASAAGYERVAHLAPVELPGGDAAVRAPCRVALSFLLAAGVDWTDDLPPVQQFAPDELGLLRQQIERRVACVPTSSMGRLFDAVASLLGLRHHISYEAQAAIQLEVVAARADEPAGPYRFAIDGSRVEHRALVRRIVHDLRDGVGIEPIARAFHDAVVEVVVELAERFRHRTTGDVVALSGGVFQNALLTALCIDRLGAEGFRPLTHHLVPPNDGGLALGQAYVAAHRSVGVADADLPVPTGASSKES